MKKNILIIILLAGFNNCFAQKSEHRLFLGANLTSTGKDNGYPQGYKTFKNPKAGFNAGYNYIFHITPAIAIGAGIGLQTIKSEFYRGANVHYIIYDPYPLTTEEFNITRFSIPVQGYYKFFRKEKLGLYATIGLNFIFSNKTDRRAEYYIPVFGTPNYEQFVYKDKQSIKFGNDKTVGTSILTGIGSDFAIKKRYFTAELSFHNDLSQSKYYCLKNIEDDGFFYVKFKRLQLNLSYLIRRREK